jgi:CubicO group peptidase (beta-lactamase class C family)
MRRSGHFMRRRRFLAGLAAAAAAPLASRLARAQSAALPADAIDQIAAFVELVRARWRVPGVAVAVLQGGEPVMVQGFGVKNLVTGEPVDAHTSFEIGSCSKAYTAAAAALLVEDGRIGWDDPVKRVMPELALYDPAITDQVSLRDLLSHRVGLSRAHLAEFGSDLSRAEVLARAVDAPKLAEFRARHCYSNLGFVIAAEVVSRLAGEPFDRFVARHFLEPLGMADSTAVGQGWRAIANVAYPHEEWDYRQIPVMPLDHDNLMGAGSLYVSAHDAVAWLQLQLGRSGLIEQASLDEMHRVQIETSHAYGLGWEIGTNEGRRFVAHSGATRGFRSRTRIEPEIGYASFVAVNGEGGAPQTISGFINQLLNQLPRTDLIDDAETAGVRRRAKAADRLEADKKADPLDGATALPLSAFAGRYRNRGFGELTLDEAGDALRISLRDASSFAGWLVRYGGSGFAYQFTGFSGRTAPRPLRLNDPRVHFQLDQDKVVGLELLDMWFGPSSFERA